MQHRSSFVAVVLLSSALGAPASAQTTLVSGLGGTAGYGTQCLGRNDDGSSRMIDLTPIFPTGIQFFDDTHTSMFVNTNGNVTFSGGLATYTPDAFPVAGQPMIAPFWADVDIRGTACAEPDGGTGFAGACTNPASNGVWWHLDTAGERVIVTWDRVGYYQCAVNRLMSFQLILTPAPTVACTTSGGADFDVEFRFNRCEWNTGDASGGSGGLAVDEACVRPLPFLPEQCPSNPTLPCVGGRCRGVPAQSGFDAGNTTDFVEIMGSRTNTIHTILCTMSNVGEDGVWRFQIRSGVVICPDAGGPCSTGMPGVCSTGRMQCVGGGTECRPEVTAGAERCDALDNDCDGMVDEGMGLCASSEVCDRGTCVGGCFEGGCVAGQVCTSAGRCVDAGCETITCPEGERCEGGACVGACDGVTCPAGRSCRGGRCVDPCTGAVCDECTVCADGACVVRCDFEPCPSGQTCLADGSCIESSCATVTCPPGQACRAGACVDACMGATCPRGEMCAMGECVPEVIPDGGVPMPTDGGGTPGVDGGGIPGTDGGMASGDGSAAADGGVRARGSSGPSCACRVGESRDAPKLPAALAALALVVVLSLRRTSGCLRRRGR